MTKRPAGVLGGLLAVVALAVTALAYTVMPVRSSDHQDSPTVVARPAADITDVFIYPAPNPANVVLQMDVDPLLTPATTSSASLDPSVLYQFKLSHGATGGPEDMVIQLMAQGTGPTQTVNVYGPFTPSSPGTVDTVGALSGNVPFNNTAGTTLSNGMKVFVGPRADPFFFDLFAFFKFLPDRNYKTAGTTAPAGTPFSFNFTPAEAVGQFASCLIGTPTDALSSNSFNVLSIVIEAPRALIAPTTGSQLIHVWTTTATQSGT